MLDIFNEQPNNFKGNFYWPDKEKNLHELGIQKRTKKILQLTVKVTASQDWKCNVHERWSNIINLIQYKGTS